MTKKKSKILASFFCVLSRARHDYLSLRAERKRSRGNLIHTLPSASCHPERSTSAVVAISSTFKQVFPLRINRINQFFLCFSVPTFNLFLSFNSIKCRRVFFCINKFVHIIPGAKRILLSKRVFCHSASNIICHSNIKHRVIFVCQKIYKIFHNKILTQYFKKIKSHHLPTNFLILLPSTFSKKPQKNIKTSTK